MTSQSGSTPQSVNPQPESEEVRKLNEQIALATRRKELLAAEQALAEAQKAPTATDAEHQAALEALKKKSELLEAELKAAQTQKSILSEITPSGTTKPKSGEVTADDSRRFLSELVANEGLTRAADKIAREIDEKLGEKGARGGILIVDDLLFAAQDIYYLEITKKLDILCTLAQKEADRCRECFGPEEEKECKEAKEARPLPGEEEAEAPKEGVMGLATPSVLDGAALAGGLGVVSGGLAAIGDIIGYFRSDYVFKGQTFDQIDDLYIQALVAGKLSKLDHHVYLFNFNTIATSPLLEKLGQLQDVRMKMVLCAERAKSRHIDAQQAQVQALETHLASLRARLVETLAKVNDEGIHAIQSEIDQAIKQAASLKKAHTPDAQITALETYLASLRAKLVDEQVKDSSGAKAALELEIQKIVKQLEENEQASPDKKLSEARLKALNDQLKLLQARLVEVLVASGNQTASALRKEIDVVTTLLQNLQASRVTDSEVSALETHLANLRAKLIECLMKNESATVARLKDEIQQVKREIKALQAGMRLAKAIVNSIAELNKAIDAFITVITTAPAGGGYPPLVAACLREYINDERIKYLLKLKLVSISSDFIVQKPPIYAWYVKTSYLGGGVVSYMMAEKDGKIAAAGTVADGAGIEHDPGQEPKAMKWKLT